MHHYLERAADVAAVIGLSVAILWLGAFAACGVFTRVAAPTFDTALCILEHLGDPPEVAAKACSTTPETVSRVAASHAAGVQSAAHLVHTGDGGP